MPAAEIVQVHVANRVGTLRLADRARQNPLDGPAVAAIDRALGDLGANADVHVVVIEGLPEVFCSGGTAEVLRALTVEGEAAALDTLLPQRVFDCPVPVIAAMAGHAFGAGLVFGLCADIIVLGRESRYGLTFMEYGFIPGMGATRLLEHVCSPAVAHELLYAAENLRGVTFEGRTGINYILPRDEVVPKAHQLAVRIARKPRSALTWLKRTLSVPRRQAFESAQLIEAAVRQINLSEAAAAVRIESALARHSALRATSRDRGDR